jgi:two-component system chemotaxis response regulator CheB
VSTTRVFVVDDSALVRQFMGMIIQATPGLELVGNAGDPLAAMERMRADWPDVIVLDVEMPKMDGLTFLKQIMATRPTPVVICSSLTGAGTELCLDALAAGAVAVFAKARINVREQLEQIGEALVRALKEAGQARPMRRAPAPAQPQVAARPVSGLRHTTDRIAAIGTSTGGTLALEHILTRLPPDAPPMAIVQHMPERFTAAFAQRLDSLCAIQVREARHGDALQVGRALIAPGGQHMSVVRSGGHYAVELSSAPPVNRHRPSVDVLFRSAARAAGGNALGMILTGMGDDGAQGLLEMRRAGAQTLAQDEASCVVFGMPKEAIALGGAERVLPLANMASEIVRFGREQAAAGGARAHT